MKKIMLAMLTASIIFSLWAGLSGNKSYYAVQAASNGIGSDFAVEKGNVWTPAFQLCWNEFIKLTQRDKAEYVNGSTKFIDELNKQSFVKDDISEESYYIAVGKQNLKLKKKIQNDIKKKFNETSDILDLFEFKNTSDAKTAQWFLYSILIKNFAFSVPFDNLESDYFNRNKTAKYKYFGYTANMRESENIKLLKKDISPLFYVSDDDFALKITDKSKKDEMILYLADTDKTFNEIYDEILQKQKNQTLCEENRIKEIKDKYQNSKNRQFTFKDYYKIPYLKINETIEYDAELANKPIKDKNYEIDSKTWIIDKTVQTIKFELDNEGAKLKSEAAISAVKMSMGMRENIILNNYFYFDRPFVIFLKEKDKDKPYFAARIKDGKYLLCEK